MTSAHLIGCLVLRFYWWRFCFILFQLLEANIVKFVKAELKSIQTVLSSECLLQSEHEEMVDGDEERSRSCNEAFLKITVDFLRRMSLQDLADRLQSSKIFEL